MKTYLYLNFFALLVLSGCSTPFGVRSFSKDEWVAENYRNVLNDSELSQLSQDYLKREGKYEHYEESPELVIHELSKKYEVTKNRRLLALLVELTYAQADKRDNEYETFAYYLTSASYSYAYLFDESIETQPLPYETSFFNACRFYNCALEEIVKFMMADPTRLSKIMDVPLVNGECKILPAKSNLPDKLTAYKEFISCYDFQPRGFHVHTRQSGLGIPLIASLEDKKWAKNLFNLGKKAHAATAFLRLSRTQSGSYNAQLEFFNAFETSTIDINDNNIPLEYDITAYFGFLMQTGSLISPLAGLFDSSSMLEQKGLYFVTPYDPDKIPIIFVHGLLSQPSTWTQMINSLLQNDEIRKKYQFGMFAYSTGNPILYSANLLRTDLAAYRKKHDPESKNKNFDNMVLVGHSMGGVISKVMLQDADNLLFEKLIPDTSIDQLDVTVEQREFIDSMIRYKRLPYVQRAVFISAPHKGSKMAQWSITNWASSLIELPKSLVGEVVDIQKKILVKSTIIANKDDVYVATGLDNLDPDNKAIKAISEIPISNEVPYHSIIGNDEQASVRGGTDGIVPYWSSHLSGAQSELIIKSDHSAQLKADAILEVERILLLHLEK